MIVGSSMTWPWTPGPHVVGSWMTWPWTPGPHVGMGHT